MKITFGFVYCRMVKIPRNEPSKHIKSHSIYTSITILNIFIFEMFIERKNDNTFFIFYKQKDERVYFDDSGYFVDACIRTSFFNFKNTD